MTCRGVRPDGGQCMCPEEYLDQSTGLCASCAAGTRTCSFDGSNDG